MKVSKLFFAAAVLASGITAADAQDFKSKLVQAGTITVGTSGTVTPFSYSDASGKLEGFDIDVMNRVAAELKLPVRYVTLDFSGLLPGLTAGRFDVVASGVTRTPQRMTSTEFKILSPYIVNGVAITRRAGDTRINGWKDVCGKRMGGVRGGVFQKIAMEKLPAGCVTELREYPAPGEMLLDLGNNRIDFMAHDFLGISYTKVSTKANIDVLPDILETITQSLAVNAKNPELTDTIDKMLIKWRADKSLDALIVKRFGASLDWSLVK